MDRSERESRTQRSWEQMQRSWKQLSRIHILSRLLIEVHELKKQHRRLKRKSFKFEFKGLDYACKEDAHDEAVGVFKGRLIIPPQEYDLFNVTCVDNRPGAGPTHKYLPLLYDHNPQMLIGAILLRFTFPSFPAGTHFPSAHTPQQKQRFFEIYEWEARCVLVLAIKKAKEIYASIEKRGQKAIKEFEVGYRIEKPVPPRNFTTFIYEVSIGKD